MKLSKICSVVGVVMTLVTCEAIGQFCDWFSHLGFDHTMCVYEERACPNKALIRSNGLTCDEKRAALEAHNEYRQFAALGGSGNPQAQNIVEMVWDNELAAIAQRWADQCSFGHDANRNVDRFSVNQNVAIFTSRSEFPDFSADVWAAVKMWYDEVSMFDTANLSPFVFDRNTGHYTQVVWADSFAVGCGFTVYEENGAINKLYVCNYGPAGNMIGAEMYVPGPRNCANFPYLSDSPRYSGLCEVAGTNPPYAGC